MKTRAEVCSRYLWCSINFCPLSSGLSDLSSLVIEKVCPLPRSVQKRLLKVLNDKEKGKNQLVVSESL